jgi:hypothetical protein
MVFEYYLDGNLTILLCVGRIVAVPLEVAGDFGLRDF